MAIIFVVVLSVTSTFRWIGLLARKCYPFFSFFFLVLWKNLIQVLKVAFTHLDLGIFSVLFPSQTASFSFYPICTSRKSLPTAVSCFTGRALSSSKACTRAIHQHSTICSITCSNWWGAVVAATMYIDHITSRTGSLSLSHEGFLDTVVRYCEF